MATLHLHQPSDPPVHGVTQVGEKLLLPAEKLPGPPHVQLQLGQVPGRLELLEEDPLVGRPEVFNGVHVWALARPVQKSEPLLIKPGHHHPRLVTRSPILLEDVGPCLRHGVTEVLGEDFLVEVLVHLLVPGEDVEP